MEERCTFGQRVADRVATFGGSWTFIFIFGGILVTWMAANTLLLAHVGNGFSHSHRALARWKALRVAEKPFKRFLGDASRLHRAKAR
jgi:hypothetical protein